MQPLGGDTALLTKVKSHELEAFGMNRPLITIVAALDDLFEAAYKIRCPLPYEHENRQDLIRIFNVIAKELYGKFCPVVEEFGSFVMNMFSSDSDLDLSINFNNCATDLSKKKRVNALRIFAKKFRKLQGRGLVKDVLLVPSARVPVLKVTDCGTNIECDFSVENRDGIAKSHIVFMIATIDERLRKLSILLKAWAKAHCINSSKDGTLNSLSLILLAAFHLQHTEPPILPPFSVFFRDGYDPPTVKKNVAPYLNYGQKNKESLIQLFVTLLIRLKSVETLWAEGLCASVYEGSWIYKRYKNKLGISVEDFSDRSQNVARALQQKRVSEVYHSIDKSLFHIMEFVDGKITRQGLEKLLFGPCPPRMTKNVITLDQRATLPPVFHDPTPTKETQLAPSKEENSAPSKDGVRTHDDQSGPHHLVLNDPTPRKKMRLTEEKKKGKSNKKKQPRKRVSPRTQEAEAFDRRGGSATQNTKPHIHMHRTEGIRVHEMGFAPPFAHDASSSQSFIAFPPTLPYYPFDPSSSRSAFPHVPLYHPPQFGAAGYPPIRDPAYDPYFQQASHNIYRTPQVPYNPVRLEHYRTSEVSYPERMERVWSDYSNEVLREVPYPGRPQIWPDRHNEAPRRAHGPPYYGQYQC